MHPYRFVPVADMQAALARTTIHASAAPPIQIVLVTSWSESNVEQMAAQTVHTRPIITVRKRQRLKLASTLNRYYRANYPLLIKIMP